MIPSANSAIRDSPPPEKRLRNPRTLLPLRFFWMASTAWVLIPGAGMCEPSRYSASNSAVIAIFFRMSGTVKALRMVLTIYSTSWQVPPAASIFSRAAAEKPWAWTVRALEMSPRASTLTGTSLRVARPLPCSAARSTLSPASKRASRSATLTGWVWVRNGSKGMDFFMCGPRSLRIRMWIGFWPPSKRVRSLAPDREPAPFWPRPDVLPVPEPSPRPTRLRALREPRGGLSEWRPISSGIGAHQVADGVDHAPQLGGVVALDGVADPAQAERAQRGELALVGPVGRLDLGDRDAHELAASSAAGSSVVSPSASGASGAPWPFASPRPSTALIDRPRSSATSSGVRRP